MPCIIRLSRGPRQGQECGASCATGLAAYCRRHKEPFQLLSLPEGAIAHAMKFMILQSPSQLGMMQTLSSCSTQMRDVAQQHWKLVYELSVLPKLTEEQVSILEERGLTLRQRVDLVCGSHCVGCGTRRNTRVCWPFPLRMCKSCIPVVLSSKTRLKDAYGIPGWAIDDMPARLSYKQRHFFLAKDVMWHLGVQRLMFAGGVISTRSREAVAKELGTTLEELCQASPEFNGMNFSHCPTSPDFRARIDVVREQLHRWRWYKVIDEWGGAPGMARAIVCGSVSMREAIATRKPDPTSVDWDTVQREVSVAELNFEVAALREEFSTSFRRVCARVHDSIIDAKLDTWFADVDDIRTLRIRASHALRVQDMVKLKCRCLRWMRTDINSLVDHFSVLVVNFNRSLPRPVVFVNADGNMMSSFQQQMYRALSETVSELEMSVFEEYSMDDFRAMLCAIHEDETHFKKTLIASLAERYIDDLERRDIPIPAHFSTAYSLTDLYMRYNRAISNFPEF